MKDLPPVSRTDDPITSHMAEAEINKSGQRERHMQWTLDWVTRFPNQTARELSFRIARGDKYKEAYYHIRLHKRLSDLKNMKVIKSGFKRTCTVGNRKAVVWYLPKDELPPVLDLVG